MVAVAIASDLLQPDRVALVRSALTVEIDCLLVELRKLGTADGCEIHF